MKNFIFSAIALFFLMGTVAHAQQVTGIYTDFDGFWTSSSSAINPNWPDDHHLLLGFTWNGTTYSTGVNDQILIDNGISFDNYKFRALPIFSVPNSSQEPYYFIGFGELSDGIANGTDDGATYPFGTNPDSEELASYLTDGEKGLDISTGLTNIPSGSSVRLNLSTHGIDGDAIDDGVPDLLITQMAVPTPDNSSDKIRFIDDSGNTVGSEITMDMSSPTNFPVLGKWWGDFYNLSSVGIQIKREKPIKLFAIELSDFDITSSNYQNAVALIYTPGGDSDPAFIAYNEPSIGVASEIGITSSSITTDCDGNISAITVRLQDSFHDVVQQANYIITATITTGPGDLLGASSVMTDSSGQAVFNDLAFEVGGDHIITFTSSSLGSAVTEIITPADDCNPSGELIWDGSTNTDWSDPTNWTTEIVPNANFDVIIPSGMPNYPVLDIDTGAKNLNMAAGSSIDLNGHLFTIAGQISASGNPYIEGATEGSELYMSGTSAQVVPSGFLNGEFDKFTEENTAGVEMDSDLRIMGVLNVIEGELTTNGNITLGCDFNAGTAQIAPLTGTISGDVTAEQCFPARRAFRFISSSVNTSTSIRINWQENAADYQDNDPAGYGTHITGVGTSPDGTNGFDYTPSGNPSMFLYNNVSSTWSSIDNTDVNTLDAGMPYRLMIRGDRTIDVTDNETNPTNTRLRATGTIEKGPVTMNNFSSSNGAFNFFGNPFHAAVDMNQVLIRATNVNPNYYYMWDPTLGGAPGEFDVQGGRGAFVTIDLTSGGGPIIPDGVSGTTEANKFLQPVQAAFFVTGTGGATPQLTFLETDKNVGVPQTATFRTNTIYRNPFMKVNLFTQANYAAGETASDGLKIKFNDYGNNGADMKDAPKFGNLDENLARTIDGGYYSIESRNFPENGEILPLFINQYRFTDYTFVMEINDLPENITAYLKDAYLDTETELNANSLTALNFEVDETIPESIAPDRFSITFNVSALEVDETVATTFSLYPNPAVDGNFFVSLPNSAGDEVHISLYNVLGQKVYNTEGTMGANNRINVQAGRLNAGIYVVEMIHNEKKSTQKLIVR